MKTQVWTPTTNVEIWVAHTCDLSDGEMGGKDKQVPGGLLISSSSLLGEI